MDQIISYIFIALASLIALTVHEYSHGYIAYKLGDPTPQYFGRLTLNPVKHIDIMGAVCMILFKFGWAKPVPVNPRYFRKPKRDFALVALAGPLSNIFLALLGAFLFSLTLSIFSEVKFSSDFLLAFCTQLVNFVYVFHLVNLGLALFNLIPIPPLDGSRILNIILPERIYFKIMQYEKQIYFVFLGWLLLGDVFKRALLSLPIVNNISLLKWFAGILSLSDIIGTGIGFISEALINLFNLLF